MSRHRQSLGLCLLWVIGWSAERAPAQPTTAKEETLRTAQDIRRALRDAREIRVYRRLAFWEAPVAVLSARSHPEQFRRLKAATSYVRAGKAEPRLATGEFVLLCGGRSYRADYAGDAGAILAQTPTAWAVVNRRVSDWLRPLLAAKPLPPESPWSFVPPDFTEQALKPAQGAARTRALVSFCWGILCAILCRWVAAWKGLSPWLWAAMGFFTGGLALVGVLLIPGNRGDGARERDEGPSSGAAV